MQSFLQNKQMIHIIVEVIIFVGLVYYHNLKFKKLSSRIVDLKNRIEKQEETEKNNEVIITNLSNKIKQLETTIKMILGNSKNTEKVVKQNTEKVVKQNTNKPKNIPVVKQKKKLEIIEEVDEDEDYEVEVENKEKYKIIDTNIKEIVDDEDNEDNISESSFDMDSEIQEELAELNLKKQ